MKKFIVIFSAVVIAAYLFLGRSYLFADLEKHLRIMQNAYYSSNIDLSRKHIFKWKIGKSDWEMNYGLSDIFLKCERTPVLTEKNLWDKEFELDVRIDAYAITENNIRASRLIRNYFFPTNEPMKNKKKLWAGWPDKGMEFCIGSIMRFPKEDIFIEMTIQKPDYVLNRAAPRLKIVGDYDGAVLGYIPLLRFLKDGMFFICIIALCFITFQSWKSLTK